MSNPPPDRVLLLKRLLVIRWVAILDLLLLIPLVIAALNHSEGTVDILGPIHGVGFLVLVALVVHGALKKLWGWWFPLIVVLTGGPPGSLYGEFRIRRRFAASG